MNNQLFNPHQRTILDDWSDLLEGKVEKRCFFIAWRVEGEANHSFLFISSQKTPEEVADSIAAYVEKQSGPRAIMTCVSEITGKNNA